MDKMDELANVINKITLKIEQEYPELYAFLDENPDTIPKFEFPVIDVEAYEEYLDSLKQLLAHYAATHQAANG